MWCSSNAPQIVDTGVCHSDAYTLEDHDLCTCILDHEGGDIMDSVGYKGVTRAFIIISCKLEIERGKKIGI
jgi:hypothetical protein